MLLINTYFNSKNVDFVTVPCIRLTILNKIFVAIMATLICP